VRRGVSLAEMVFAALILAMGLVPVVSGIQSTARDARLLETRSQVIARARGMLGAAQVLGPRVFENAPEAGGEATLQIGLPAGGAAKLGETSSAERIGYTDERVLVKEVAKVGRAKLYKLTAVLRWVHPAEPTHPHEVQLVTLQGDPLISMNQESP
jgi:hypothetical protein